MKTVHICTYQFLCMLGNDLGDEPIGMFGTKLGEHF